MGPGTCAGTPSPLSYANVGANEPPRHAQERSMNKSRIPFAPDQIAAFCSGRRIRRLALFGGRKVDLVTERSLNRWTCHRVHNEAEVLYAAQG